MVPRVGRLGLALAFDLGTAVLSAGGSQSKPVSLDARASGTGS